MKRAQASDIVALMDGLGHGRFAVAGRAVPIGEAFERADWRFARDWWHWFFSGRPPRRPRM